MKDQKARIEAQRAKIESGLKSDDPLTRAASRSLASFRAAGEKLILAKSQLPPDQWEGWLKRNFKITDRQARGYMQLADPKFDAGEPTRLQTNSFIKRFVRMILSGRRAESKDMS
jgi:hypothetical protein